VAVLTSQGPSPSRKRAATETSSFVERLRKRWRSSSGAVTRKASGSGWRPLGPGLNSGAAGRPQGPDHLHVPVAALGHARGLSCQNSPGCCLRVDRIGFAVAPEMAALGPFDLHNRDARGLQVAGESGSIALLVPSTPADLTDPKPSAQRRSSS
jgi:hypothetical protein